MSAVPFLSMAIGDLVNLQLRMASSLTWAVLCSSGPTLSSSSAAAKTNTAIFSPARSQASTSTSCATPSLTIPSSDRGDTLIGESFTLLHQSRSVFVISRFNIYTIICQDFFLFLAFICESKIFFHFSSGFWPWQLRPSPWPHHREPPPNISEDAAGWGSALPDRDNDGPPPGCHAEIGYTQPQQGRLGGGWHLCFLLQGQ